MTEALASRDDFLARLVELEKQLAGTGPDWLRASRRAHSGRFDTVGLPRSTDEDWRNTNLSPIRESRFRPAPRIADCGPGDGGLAADLGGARIVFVDGRFAPEQSELRPLPEGAWVGSLAEALEKFPQRVADGLALRPAEEAPAFVALNGALFADGGFVWIPERAVIEAPVHLIHATNGSDDPSAVHTRTLVHAGDGSRATLVELFCGLGDGGYLHNAVTDVTVGDQARLDHVRIQDESERAFHVSNVTSRQGRDSRYASLHLELGGRLARHDLTAIHQGEGGDCRMDGLYLTHGRQHVDFHTVLDHRQPHCDSHELFKGVLADRSRAVFHGRIIVRQEAQRTDAKQSNPNLVLSEGAQAHTRPQLEIYADDVKCTHGATIGRLDREAIAYLRARAIPEREARNLMVSAFAGEIVDRVPVESLRDDLRRVYDRRLSGLEME